jgi:hypothetical protein
LNVINLFNKGNYMKKEFCVYVIRLKSSVAKKSSFSNRNPEMKSDKPCIYVGSSVLAPLERYHKHLTAKSGSKWVKEFGNGLHERLTNKQPTYTNRVEAEFAEYALALRLRSKGYGVWTNLPAVPPFYKATRFKVSEDIVFPQQFAIITAYATTGEHWKDEENRRADRKLKKRVESVEQWHARVTGYSPTSGHQEPGWAVALGFDAACDLGRQFKQDAIYWVEADRLYISYCDTRQAKVPVRALFSERLGAELE